MLDRLLEWRFINDGEKEAAKTKRREERARYVIDLVRHKGPGACSYLIENFCELDPTLSQFLNLRTPDLG
uniref:CARD domain-containing protein n=1 Tax=Sphaeramia orbicularis TaxID=375764 RepID=A0A673CN50_9TELE